MSVRTVNVSDVNMSQIAQSIYSSIKTELILIDLIYLQIVTDTLQPK